MSNFFLAKQRNARISGNCSRAFDELAVIADDLWWIYLESAEAEASLALIIFRFEHDRSENRPGNKSGVRHFVEISR